MSATYFANVNNNGNPNYNNANNTNGVRPDSLPDQQRRRCCPFFDEIHQGEMTNPDAIYYDNGASIKGRGISFSRKRFEVHLRRYYQEHGNNGYILFGDFSKFYDNIIHEIAKRELLKLFDDDEFVDWLLTLIFDGFKIDVLYMTDKEYSLLFLDFNQIYSHHS